MKSLVIVESPSKCKKIEEYLGENYKVIASCGHITKLDSIDQINFDTCEVKFKKDKLKVIQEIKKEIKLHDEVILATDDDREGEAIAWHICKQCNLNIEKTKRILFNEITKEALLKSINNYGYLNMPRVYSQQTRQILDLYIGFKISPLLWKYILNKLSAGRCQTPAVHMIYEKEKEYLSQSLNTHIQVNGYFTDKQIKFQLSKKLEQEECEDFLDNCKDYSFKLNKDIDQTKHTENRPPILITTSLQQLAHQMMSLSPKTTMSYAQTLYENGLITYMRTDCASYNDSFKESLKDFILKKYGKDYFEPIIEKDKKAHEGIRVTDLSKEKVQFECKGINQLYNLIYKHTIQTSMSNCKVLKKKYIILAPLDNEFIYIENSIQFDGWKIMRQKEPSESYSLYLQQLKEIKYSKIEGKEIIINPIYHYCESQLIKKLEKESIGRPSTYASILSKIQDKNYVTKGTIKGRSMKITNYELKDDKITKNIKDEIMQEEKNKLSITNTGILMIDFCYKYYSHLFNYPYTKKLEETLDKIEYENYNWKETIKEFKKDVDIDVKITDEKQKVKSLHCGYYNKEPLVIKEGQFGYYLEYKKIKKSLIEWKFYNNIIDYIENKEQLSDELIKNLIDFHGIRILNKEISIRNGKYGFYIYYKNSKMKKPKFYSIKEELLDKTSNKELLDIIKKEYNI